MLRFDVAEPTVADAIALLESLNDPSLLAENRLARLLGPAVREQVLEAANACRRLHLSQHHAIRAARHYAIVVRCDLEREPVKVVASDLGISVRQYFRERHAARGCVARILVARFARSTLSIADVETETLAHATALAELGQPAAALKEFRELASVVRSPLRKAHVMARIARVQRDTGRLADAERTLCALRAGVPSDDHIQANAARLWQQLVESEILAERGHVREAEIAFDGLATTLREIPAPGDGEIGEVTEAAIEVLVALAMRSYEGGRLHEALDQSIRGLRLHASSLVPRVTVREEYRRMQALVLYELGRIDLADLHTSLAETIRRMRGAGLLAQAAVAYCTLGTVANDPVCLAEAVRLAQRHGSLSVRRLAHLASAAAATVYADWSRAEYDIRELLACGFDNATQRAQCFDLQSRMATAQGDLRAAFSAAQSAYAIVEGLSNARGRGAVMRTMAEIQLKRGHRNEAFELIEEAIELIEAHGSPTSLSLAHTVRNQIVPYRSATR